jgi:hypothetical protein
MVRDPPEARVMGGKQEDVDWLEQRREVVEAVGSGLLTGKEAPAARLPLRPLRPTCRPSVRDASAPLLG